MSIQPMAYLALRAAGLGARVLLQHVERIHQLQVEDKGSYEEVSELDRRSEEAIVNALRGMKEGACGALRLGQMRRAKA